MKRVDTAHFRVAAILAGMLGGWALDTTDVRADDTSESVGVPLEEVVVTAKKRVEPPTDEQVTQQVEKALDKDPYIYAEHITVTTKNGVVRLDGMVGDAGELIRVLRLSRKIPGARRIIDDLQIQASFPD